MTDTTTTTTTRDALADIKRRWLDAPAEPEPADPILRAFARRKVPEGSRLRALYAAYQTAGEPVAALKARIAEADQELRAAYAQALQLGTPRERRVDAFTPLPTIEDAAELVACERRAQLVNELIDVWKRQLTSAELERQRIVKDWLAAHEAWGGAVYTLEGDATVLPPKMIVSTWKKPDAYQRTNLLATLAGLER